jgi:uncharacterized protein YlbG (UPF0298 family)
MSDSSNHWSKNDLQAYLLLYCANADFIGKEEEMELIKSKVSSSDYKSISKEFNNDNDYQSIQKIQDAVRRLNLSETEIDGLIAETKDLFLSDGDFAASEQALFAGIKKLLG